MLGLCLFAASHSLWLQIHIVVQDCPLCGKCHPKYQRCGASPWQSPVPSPAGSSRGVGNRKRLGNMFQSYLITGWGNLMGFLCVAYSRCSRGAWIPQLSWYCSRYLYGAGEGANLALKGKLRHRDSKGFVSG